MEKLCGNNSESKKYLLLLKTAYLLLYGNRLLHKLLWLLRPWQRTKNKNEVVETPFLEGIEGGPDLSITSWFQHEGYTRLL